MSRFASRFFLHRAFGFVAPHVALHRVSIRTLDELSWCKLGAGWGSRGRVDAAISRSASRTKTRSQSSEHGVVATGEHDHLFRQHLRRRAHTALR